MRARPGPASTSSTAHIGLDHVPRVEPSSPLVPHLLSWTESRFVGKAPDNCGGLPAAEPHHGHQRVARAAISARHAGSADDPRELVATDDVRRLEVDETWSGEVGSGDRFSDLLAVRAIIQEQRNERRGIADDAGAHRRSSRAARIVSASMLTPVASTRARARAMTSSTDGRAAASSSIPRRYSTNDLPARAARAASSSRTSSGTPRTVIAALTLDHIAGSSGFQRFVSAADLPACSRSKLEDNAVGTDEFPVRHAVFCGCVGGEE